jgi:hypothetical protein
MNNHQPANPTTASTTTAAAITATFRRDPAISSHPSDTGATGAVAVVFVYVVAPRADLWCCGGRMGVPARS